MERSVTSIFDLTFTTLEVGALDAWIIDGELSRLSNHEMIVFDMRGLDDTVGGMRTSEEVIEWNVKCMSDDAKKGAPAG